MDKVKLGSQGAVVSRMGLGCMGMSEFYGQRDDAESAATLLRALELGMTFLDTADMYGIGDNEELIGKTLKGRRREAFLATKFGNVRRKSDPTFFAISGRSEYVKEACDASLKRLGTDHIDLYYQHRVDPNTPIEDTVGAMSELVKAGKVKYLGLSEASPATIRRAHKVHPITAPPDRVFPLDPRRRGRDPAHAPRAGHRVRAVQPARAWLPDWCHYEADRPGRYRRAGSAVSPVRRGGVRQEHGAGREGEDDR
jgi:aryl-alcohol dehydrogenase-like predicted oxidoreductase